ncbi:MAG: heme-copper oxidase subunit III [bacterium]
MSQTTTAKAGSSQDFGANRNKLGMWFFLCADAMMFAGLFGGYFMVRLANGEAWPIAQHYLNIPLTAVFTFDLIISSVTMVKAYESADTPDGEPIGVLPGLTVSNAPWVLRTFLGLTVLFGAAFIGFQYYEWSHFINYGLLPWDFHYEELTHIYHGLELGTLSGAQKAAFPLFFGCFYALTGFHGFHVTCGVIYNSVILINDCRGKYESDDEAAESIETAGLYWHFVDLVWILLFTFIYLV